MRRVVNVLSRASRWPLACPPTAARALLPAFPLLPTRALCAPSNPAPSNPKLQQRFPQPRRALKRTTLSTFPPGDPGHKELIRRANLPQKFSPAKLTFDLDEQRRQMGPFCKADTVIPFMEYDKKKLIDMRFANPILTGKQLTPEAETLRKSTFEVMLYTSAAGKTSTIFDVARTEYTIYVACGNGAQDDKSSDEAFYGLISDIDQTIRSSAWKDDHNGAMMEVHRLILAEICARVVFLRWFMETCPQHERSPENFLITQLNGGQRLINLLYELLRQEHLGVIQGLVVNSRATLLSTEAAGFRYAIDEAHIAGQKYYSPTSVGHVHDSRSQFINHSQNDEQHSLLYKYAHSVSIECPTSAVIIAGTEMDINLAKELQADMEITLAPLRALPVLKVADVRDRLMRMLNVTEDELDQCETLHMLQGRPRWCATVIREIPDALQNPLNEGKLKHNILERAIRAVVHQWTDKEVARLAKKLNRFGKLKKRGDRLEILLQKLFTVYSLFEKHEQGITLFFDDADVNLLLAYDLGQVAQIVNPHAEFHRIALDDYITRNIVLQLGEKRGWKATKLLTTQLEAVHTLRPKAAGHGVSFQLVCAAALSSFNGTVAELVQTISPNTDLNTLPAWTKGSRVGGFSFEQLRDVRDLEQLIQQNPDGGTTIVNPKEDMGIDIFGMLAGPPGLSPSAPFSLTASVKFLDEAPALSGNTAMQDVLSTTQDDHGKQASAKYWAPLLSTINSKCGNRALHIHFAFRKVFSARTFNDVEGEDGKYRLKTVHVDGEQVRLIIDPVNSKGFFKDPLLEQVLNKLSSKRER